MEKLKNFFNNKKYSFIFFIFLFYLITYITLNIDFNARIDNINKIIDDKIKQDDVVPTFSSFIHITILFCILHFLNIRMYNLLICKRQFDAQGNHVL